MFQHIVTAWRIDRGCSRMLEHAKPNLICNNQVHGCCNIAVQSCYIFHHSLATCRGVATGGMWGVSHPPKNFKNRGNSGKIRGNSGKIRENSGKIMENSVTSGNICGFSASNKIRAIL